MKCRRVFVVFILMLATVLFLSCFFKIYEPISVTNFPVNLIKRLTAEGGNLAVKIYDPYKSERVTSVFGPIVDKGAFAQRLNAKDFFYAINSGDVSEYLKIVKFKNMPLNNNATNFYYQPYNESKLEILRKEYDGQRIAENAKNEFEKILLVRNFVNSRWRIGRPHNVDYNFNAINIIERAKRGEKFFCSEYSTVYIQLLASLGITGRYVGLLKGHVVTEVWSNDYDKWIVIDPTFNLYYEQNGIPLNALELHDVWIAGKWRYINVVSARTDNEFSRYEYKFIDFYENFFIRMRNDWFTNIYPRWHPMSNSIMNSIEWTDNHTVNDIRIAKESDNPEELYWPLNHVYVKLIEYEVAGELIILKLYLETITPNFDKFQIKFDDKDPVMSESSILTWNLHKGDNALEIVSCNKFDVKGPRTIISINYHS